MMHFLCNIPLYISFFTKYTFHSHTLVFAVLTQHLAFMKLVTQFSCWFCLQGSFHDSDGQASICLCLCPPVNKMKSLRVWPTMQFCFNPLRTCVRGQLLAAVVRKEKKAVVFRIGHVEFEGTKAAHLFRGGVRPNLKGFSCAAAVRRPQSHTQEILNRNTQTTKTSTYSQFEALMIEFFLSGKNIQKRQFIQIKKFWHLFALW